MTSPAADWPKIEDALWRWTYQAAGIPGDRVRVLIGRDAGEAVGPAPKATISMVSIVPLSRQQRIRQAAVMQQRYTVTANGPGEVGVDFYPGKSLTPQRISIMAGVGDPPATSAAALLLELQANLPAGYTASADAGDPASVLVDGSATDPEFASSPADANFLSVTTTMPRYPAILVVEHQLTMRVTFRASGVSAGPTASGAAWAADAMTRAMVYRDSWLDPQMRALGFRHAGTPQATPFVPTDRSESLATLDVRFIGYLTGAEATNLMRAVGFSTAVTPAA